MVTPVVAPLNTPVLRPLARPLGRRVAGRAGVLARPGRFPAEQYHSPRGDPGLFGPDSVAWRVHGSPSCLVGGLSALMLQTLHPLALAGVVEHSSYREDPLGRLARTSSFVAGTTFGSTAVAQELVRIVTAIHGRVRGTTVDGRPYAASDPALLTWVHVTEVDSFLRAYQRYRGRPLAAATADRYLAETARLARMMGAAEVPVTTAEVRDYYAAVRPALAIDEATREALAFLRRPPVRDADVAGAYLLVTRAAADLMPHWARRLIGHRRWPGEPVALRAAARLLVAAFGWAGENPAERQARARVAAR